MIISLKYSCCDNYAQIVNILENQLFKSNPHKVLNQRYQQMRSLVNCPSPNWGACSPFSIVTNSKDTLLAIPTNSFPGSSCCQQFDNLGHDLPYWIEVPGNEEQGRVMLVSQDPLRKNQKAGIITLSSPFGMHSIDYRGNRVMTQMVEFLLNKGYSVYLTDFNKLYGTYQNRQVTFNGMNQQFANILNEEIRFWTPTKIIAVGKVALGKGRQQGINITGISHPNARIPKAQKFEELIKAL